jgi:hypothetical protein
MEAATGVVGMKRNTGDDLAEGGKNKKPQFVGAFLLGILACLTHEFITSRRFYAGAPLL